MICIFGVSLPLYKNRKYINKAYVLKYLSLKHPSEAKKYHVEEDKREKDRKKPPIIHFQRDIPYPDEGPPAKEIHKKNHEKHDRHADRHAEKHHEKYGDKHAEHKDAKHFFDPPKIEERK